MVLEPDPDADPEEVFIEPTNDFDADREIAAQALSARLNHCGFSISRSGTDETPILAVYEGPTNCVALVTIETPDAVRDDHEELQEWSPVPVGAYEATVDDGWVTTESLTPVGCEETRSVTGWLADLSDHDPLRRAYNE